VYVGVEILPSSVKLLGVVQCRVEFLLSSAKTLSVGLSQRGIIYVIAKSFRRFEIESAQIILIKVRHSTWRVEKPASLDKYSQQKEQRFPADWENMVAINVLSLNCENDNACSEVSDGE
jgi:hypothetical protein